MLYDSGQYTKGHGGTAVGWWEVAMEELLILYVCVDMREGSSEVNDLIL